jgi:hypothetical protein
VNTVLLALFSGLPLSKIHAAGGCKPWAAKIVSLQGHVEVNRTGKGHWQPVGLEETLCSEDTIRVQARSRTAILLSNQTLLRLDEYTTVTLPKIKPTKPSWLDLLKGGLHFISRTQCQLGTHLQRPGF